MVKVCNEECGAGISREPVRAAVDAVAVGGSGPGGVVGDVGEQVEPGEHSEGEPLRGVGNEVAVDVANRGRTWKVRARVPM